MRRAEALCPGSSTLYSINSKGKIIVLSIDLISIESFRLKPALITLCFKYARHVPVCFEFHKIVLRDFQDLGLFLWLEQDQEQELCPEPIFLQLYKCILDTT